MLGPISLGALMVFSYSPRHTAEPRASDAVVLARCGMTAEALAAAGISLQDVQSLRAFVESRDASVAAVLSAAAALETAAAREAAAEEAVWTDLSDEARRAERQAAQDAFAAARQVLAAAEATLLTNLSQSLTSEKAAALAAMHARDEINVSAEWRILGAEVSPALADAATMETRALRDGTELPPDIARLLAEARADGKVTTAKTRLEAHLAEISAALE